MSIRTDLECMNNRHWANDFVCIKPMKTQDDLIYALFECELTQEQKEFVNPASFSIGRAYLFREDHYPCLIYNEKDEPVGFIHLCKWLGQGDAYSWSFFIDKKNQGKGYGRSAAELAIQILKEANPTMPIKVSTEKDNIRAQHLYTSLGFKLLEEKDGDDLVFGR